MRSASDRGREVELVGSAIVGEVALHDEPLRTPGVQLRERGPQGEDRMGPA